MTTVRFGADAIEALRAHAVEDYPLECCGMAFGPTGEPRVVTEVVRVRNVQDQLHAEDPEAHPRDARTAYFMDTAEQDAAMRSAAERGLELRALYHSHPDHGAYFSAEDRRLAAPEGWGELYPGVVYVVVSVTAAGVAAASQFAFDAEREDYDEEPIDGLGRPADRVLELGATTVPRSLILMRDALRELEPGQVLEIVSSDRESADREIPGYCDKQRLPIGRVVAEDRETVHLRITKV